MSTPTSFPTGGPAPTLAPSRADSTAPAPGRGEYAYPASIDVAANQRGMELRDYFAATAAQGLLASGEIVASKFELALEAYAVADALLLARQRRSA